MIQLFTRIKGLEGLVDKKDLAITNKVAEQTYQLIYNPKIPIKIKILQILIILKYHSFIISPILILQKFYINK